MLTNCSRYILLCLCLAAPLCPVRALAQTQHQIAGVAWTSVADLLSLQGVRYVAPGVAIVDAESGTAQALESAGFEILFEDTAPSVEGWYLADHLHAPDTHGTERTPAPELVYADDSGWALLRLETARLTQMLDLGHFLYPLPQRYATPKMPAISKSSAAFRSAAREPSAAVADLLTQVDTVRLRAVVENLVFVDPTLGAVAGNVRSRYARRSETFASTTFLQQQLQQVLGAEAVHLDSFRVTATDSVMYNVVGELAGTDPDAGTYIICAHYDAIGSRSSRADLARIGEDPGSWNWMVHPAPGADDNGSGVSVVVESARVLATAPSFPWSIRFIAWSGEELGLWGSDHYAEAAALRGDKILGVLNFDMVGFNDLSDRLELVSNPSSRWLVELMQATNERYDIGLQIDVLEDRFAGLSDHAPFWSKGYDAVLGIENYLPTDADAPSVLAGEYRINTQYHSVSDLPDSINWELVARVTRLTVATLAQFGGEEGLPNLAVFAGDLQADDGDDLLVQISNLGPVPVLQPFDVRVSSCAADSTNCSVIFQDTYADGIEAGGVAVLHVPWQRFGYSVFLVEADPEGQVTEEVEVEDNRAFQRVRLVPNQGVVIFPNPFRPERDPFLSFSGVPLFSRLRIYQSGGGLIWRGFEEDQRQTIRKIHWPDVTTREIHWFGVNTAGFAVSSGVYVYDLRTLSGELLERGKIAVVR
jgi:hypothetical protein